MLAVAAVNSLRYDRERCVNCDMCLIVCPHAVFAPDGDAVRIERYEKCMECGACQVNCPTGAILVDSDVGCAYAMMRNALTGGNGPVCCSK